MGCAQQKIQKKTELKNACSINFQTLSNKNRNQTIQYQKYYFYRSLSLKSIDQSTILKRRRTKEQITEQSSPTKLDK